MAWIMIIIGHLKKKTTRTKSMLSCARVDLSKPAEKVIWKLLEDCPETNQVTDCICGCRMATVTEEDGHPSISCSLQSERVVFQPLLV